MTIRIGGIASGMDIDSIVSDLMKVQRLPLDRLYQKQQTLEWQRDDYRSMNQLLSDLDSTIFNGVYLKGAFTSKLITSSNEGAVSAKNISSDANLSATFRVDQLAEAAYLNSAVDIQKAGMTVDPNAVLATERSNLNTDFTSNTFTIQAISQDGTLGSEVSFTIDPAVDTLNSVINRINSSDAGVNAFFDQQTGRVSLLAKNTGDAAAQAEIIVTGDFLTGSLNLAGDNIAAGINGKEGKNAQFNINGLDTERFTNTFQINGFEYTLKQVTDNGDGITQANELVTINSQTDTDAIFNKIMDFVNKYNETIGKINAKLSEEKYSKYQPLTDEQKKDMSESEIELWEGKAKSGLIRNDSILTSGLNQLRADFYTPITGLDALTDQLSELGITTSSNYLEKGKLVVNEAKLREAISNDPMAVYDVFNKKTVDGSGNLIHAESGIAVRMRDSIKKTIGNIEARAGNVYKSLTQYTIGQNLSNIGNEIDRMQDRLIKLEDRYWQQFTAMEKAIQRSNEQGAYLSQQLGSL